MFQSVTPEQKFSGHAVFAEWCQTLCFIIINYLQNNLITKCSEELEKTAKIAFFTTFSQIPMSLTLERNFFRRAVFRIMPAIKLHYSKVFPEKIVKQFSVKFEKPPKMALFTTFSGKTLKVICQVKRPKYEKTIKHY